jgi:hypothetical protein
MTRAKQAGRRLGESINEMANLMYNNVTKGHFFEGLSEVSGKESKCFTCYKKTSCESYGVVISCDEYHHEKRTI